MVVVAKKKNPRLWKKIVHTLRKGKKGGKPGQWSARKAQLAVAEYKKRGGKYVGKPSKNNSLRKWTRQKWRTKSGKNSIMGKGASGERYLPTKTIQMMSNAEYNRSTRKKIRDTKRGIQFYL